MKNSSDSTELPLCVDLDGTLIHSDLLFESVIYLLKKNFLYIFIIPFWIFKGKYYTKFRLAELVIPKVDTLPYNKDLINFLKSEKEKGRKIILVTASLQALADKVAEYLQIFDEVYGSDNGVNLGGSEKANFLTNKYGKNNFDYIGDSNKDLAVWEKANKAYVVQKSKNLTKKVEKINKNVIIFGEKKNNFKIFLRQIRIHQWVKNLLLFLPPLLAHKLEFSIYVDVFFGFLSFSFVASAIYIINDLVDINSDRNHKSKKLRPLASGEFKIIDAFKSIPILLILGFGISLGILDSGFTLILLLYTIITIAYSFYIKKIYLLDIITLSLLYTIRLLAGGVISDTTLSPWLVSFTLFIFLSLGALKRYTELRGLDANTTTKAKGRDYHVEEMPLVLNLGISTGVVATLIFTLYINNPDVVFLYKNPFYLYLIIPIILYWILRMWFIAHRGQMNDDPIAYAIKDKFSIIISILILLISIGATL